MIDNIKNVPEVYTRRSRDYQLLLKLLDVVTNSSKFDIDKINDVYDSFLCNDRMLDYLSTIYNFNPSIKFTDEDLRWMISGFGSMMKNKGTRKGIEQAISLVMKTQNITAPYTVSIVNDTDRTNVKDDGTKSQVNYYIELQMGDEINRSYLTELLEYVKPLGYTVDVFAVEGSDPWTTPAAKNRLNIFENSGVEGMTDGEINDGYETTSMITSDLPAFNYPDAKSKRRIGITIRQVENTNFVCWCDELPIIETYLKPKFNNKNKNINHNLTYGYFCTFLGYRYAETTTVDLEEERYIYSKETDAVNKSKKYLSIYIFSTSKDSKKIIEAEEAAYKDWVKSGGVGDASKFGYYNNVVFYGDENSVVTYLKILRDTDFSNKEGLYIDGSFALESILNALHDEAGNYYKASHFSSTISNGSKDYFYTKVMGVLKAPKLAEDKKTVIEEVIGEVIVYIFKNKEEAKTGEVLLNNTYYSDISYRENMYKSILNRVVIGSDKPNSTKGWGDIDDVEWVGQIEKPVEPVDPELEPKPEL